MMHAKKTAVLRRFHSIEGHLRGIERMVEKDRYCVDILRQTYAVRRAIEKLEAIILEHHLQQRVPAALPAGKASEVIHDLVQLYALAGNR